MQREFYWIPRGRARLFFIATWHSRETVGCEWGFWFRWFATASLCVAILKKWIRLRFDPGRRSFLLPESGCRGFIVSLVSVGERAIKRQSKTRRRWQVAVITLSRAAEPVGRHSDTFDVPEVGLTVWPAQTWVHSNEHLTRKDGNGVSMARRLFVVRTKWLSR